MSTEMAMFLGELGSFIAATGQLEGVVTTQTVAENTVDKLEGYLNVLTAILHSLEADGGDPDVRQLISLFNDSGRHTGGWILKWALTLTLPMKKRRVAAVC